MRTCLLLGLSVAVSACGPDSLPGGEESRAASGEPARVVVGVIDYGVNPYHDYFRAGGPLYGDAAPSSVTPALLAELEVDEEHIIDLSRTGNLESDLAADQAQWDKVRHGELYWFRGTNILSASFTGEDLAPLKPWPSKSTHGIGVVSAVLAENPEAVIVLAEVALSIDFTDPAQYGPYLGVYDGGGTLWPDAEQFVFGLPAVDLVSLSQGPQANPPQLDWLSGGYRAVVELGKLHFGAAGNHVVPATFSTAGPWWSIAVGGITAGEENGQAVLAAVAPDLVADYVREAPSCQDCETGGYAMHSGTSFSAPTAAGVASRVLLEARRLLGHAGGIVVEDGRPVMAAGTGRSISNWQLRRALEEAAWVPRTADFAPGASSQVGPQSLPVNDAAPWLQVGWGELSGDPAKAVVARALDHLGLGAAPAYKPVGFCDHQTRLIELRKLYWDSLPSSATRAPPAQDPFVYCS